MCVVAISIVTAFSQNQHEVAGGRPDKALFRMSEQLANQTLDQLGYRDFLMPREIYQTFLNALTRLTGSRVGYLHLYDETARELKLNVWSDEVVSFCMTSHESHYPLKEAGIWADCIRRRQVAIHNDYPRMSSANGLPEGHFPLIHHMSLPVQEDGRIVAVIGLGNADEPYSESAGRDALAYAQQAWPRLSEALARLERSRTLGFSRFSGETAASVLASMIRAITRAMEARDEYTASHQSNVAYISRQVGDIMGLSEDQTFGLEIGANIHDIGKIAIPNEMLIKPTQLTPPEFELIKSHAQIGASFFEDVGSPWPLQEMILQHHERMNGSGYPNGLVGDMICIEARIIAVADT